MSEYLQGFDIHILHDIIHSNLTFTIVNNLCVHFLHTIKNATNRSFPRISRKPYTKWYLKSYSDCAHINRLLFAIKTGKIYQLHPNDKSKIDVKEITVTTFRIFDKQKYNDALKKTLVEKNSKKGKNG